MIKDDAVLLEMSKNYTCVISRDLLNTHPQSWFHLSNNGKGNRWGKKQYNYTFVYSTQKTKTYSDDENHKIQQDVLLEFIQQINTTHTNNTNNSAVISKKNVGIVGVFVHSKKTKNANNQRPISSVIKKHFSGSCCVVCGSNSEIIIDHKNDLYNDPRVLNTQTQIINDFQPLCNGCNLLKRQRSKREKELHKVYSANNIPQFKSFVFPFEKKVFNEMDITCKIDTYWYDPIAFMQKYQQYILYVVPLLQHIKQTKKHNIPH